MKAISRKAASLLLLTICSCQAKEIASVDGIWETKEGKGQIFMINNDGEWQSFAPLGPENELAIPNFSTPTICGKWFIRDKTLYMIVDKSISPNIHIGTALIYDIKYISLE